jgi:hypothetical protein
MYLDDTDSYLYSCEFIMSGGSAYQLAGMTSWASTNTSLVLGSGTLPSGDYQSLLDDLDDMVGCVIGCSNTSSGSVSLSLTATTYDGPGSSVGFTYSASPMADLVYVQWAYLNYDEEAPSTDTSECPTSGDSTVCWVTAQSDGYMTVDVTFTQDRYAYAQRTLSSNFAPCPGNHPDLDGQVQKSV